MSRIRRRRWTRPILYTAALIVIGAAGASTVYLVGSSQRRADRAGYLEYEKKVLPLLREGGRIVEEEIKPSIAQLGSGEIAGSEVVQRAAGWRTTFGQIRAALEAIDPPGFLGDIRVRWGAAMDAYQEVVDELEAAGRATGADRARYLGQAEDAGKGADAVFDHAAVVMQFHRRRLGLGPSTGLPNPEESEGG